MTVALDPETPSDLLSHLIVADIAPARGALSNEFQAYIRGMKQVEASQVNTRREADHILKDVEQVGAGHAAHACPVVLIVSRVVPRRTR